MSQQDVAQSVGVRFQQIQKYECGGNRISASRLWLVARALDAPVSLFFENLPQAPQTTIKVLAEADRSVA
jgi:transcriptional regulator with XRE-family HTH domain